MENNLSHPKSKRQLPGLTLLPVSFKWIGFFIALISGGLAIVDKVRDFGIRPEDPGFFRKLMLHGVLLGLLCIAASRDEEEDEQTQAIRLRCLGSTFFLGGIYVILGPLFDLLFQDPLTLMTAVELMLFLLVIYLLEYFFFKLMR